MSSELLRTLALMVLDGEPDAEAVYIDAALEEDGSIIEEMAKSVRDARRILRDHLQVQKTIRFFQNDDNMQYIEKTKNLAIVYHFEGTGLIRIDVRNPGNPTRIVQLYMTANDNEISLENWADATIVPGIGIVEVKTWSYTIDDEGNRSRRPATLGSKLILAADVVEHIRERVPQIREDIYLKFMAAGFKINAAAKELTKRRKS